ncbi:MAG TPA: RdgB/HAM1 family non-canonical purine NTP pyrophosphatase [Candidatus Udaeobacter sp.]|nr:RdgB/HAM1 family non-canonical purine NTP pyrophosphatase [Candidatus Udaeobacter sp.]
MQLIVATRNAHKTGEIQRMLGPTFTVNDLSAHPEIPDIRETGKSYEDNAILKAIGASRRLPGLIVADDSGLEVDALGGAPGIFSARYAGENATDKQNIDKLLVELAGTGAKETKRSSRFRCVIALARQGELVEKFEGIVEGTIVERARGLHGFGYDPIFVPHGFEETFAELPPGVKDTISHRAKAIRELTAKLAALKMRD